MFLEKKGIGRPATYAQIVQVLFTRKYCAKEGKYIYPNDLGKQVSNFLKEHFSDIINVKFTAEMEDKLDKIANNEDEWHTVVKDFYTDFQKELYIVDKTVATERPPVEKTDIKCDKCGSPMVIRTSKYGKFLACSNFPKCKNTKPYDDGTNKEEKIEESDEICDKCGSKMVIKVGKFGKFLACSNYPTCKNIKNYVDKSLPTGVCPKCGKIVTERKSKKGKIFFGCSGYPKCDFISWDLPLKDKCPKCSSYLLKKFGKSSDTIYCSNNKCDYRVYIKHNDVKQNQNTYY
jgi:DNA topoisomerase-1